MSNLRDAKELGFLDLRRKRQHSANNFADGSEIILGNPLPQLQKRGVEHWLRIEHLEYCFRLHGGRAVVDSRHYAREPLLSERHQHSSANDGNAVSQTVGKHHVQRDRQSDIAKLRHEDVRNDCTVWTRSDENRKSRSVSSVQISGKGFYSSGFFAAGFNPRYFITICKSFHASFFCRGSRNK